jgi:hypothetical protein
VSSFDHLFRSPLPDSIRFAITPNVGRKNRLMPGIDDIRHRLTHQVIRDGPGLQSMTGEQFMSSIAVGLVLSGDHIEVIPPTSQFQTIVTKALCFSRERFEGKIGPLAGE